VGAPGARRGPGAGGSERSEDHGMSERAEGFLRYVVVASTSQRSDELVASTPRTSDIAPAHVASSR
jgi:hypothetical protein